MREVRNGAAISMPAGTKSARAWVAGSIATAIGSPAATARLARSAANCTPSARAGRAPSCQLWRLGETRLLKTSSVPQKNAHQPGAQQNSQAVGKRLHHSRGIRHGVQGLRDFSQDLCAAMFLA